MVVFRVVFPEHVSAEYGESYLNELLHLADWRAVEPLVYVVVPARKAAIEQVRSDLQRQQVLGQLAFEEVD